MNEKVMRHKTICDELNSLYERLTIKSQAPNEWWW